MDKNKKLVSIVSWAAGAAVTVFALVLCVTALPYRPRDISGILFYRGLFLSVGLLLIAFGFYFYPTLKHRSVIKTMEYLRRKSGLRTVLFPKETFISFQR